MVREILILCAAGSLAGQTVPQVGDINLYGARKLSSAKVLTTIGIHSGDPLPGSKGDLEEKLEALPGVVLARVTAVCCEDQRAVLFAGIEERGAAHFAFRTPPAGDAVLPQTLLDTYHTFLEAAADAARRGSVAEDLTQGHSLMADPTARSLQQQFAAFATGNLPLLRTVLRNASDPDLRAIAGAVIGYAPHKTDVIDDLQYALQDPDEAVRASAMRSLNAIAVLAIKQPDLGLKIAPTWFVEMLNSVVLSDRLRAVDVLVTLTQGRPDAIALLRDRALPALVEMARWKTLRYAVAPFVLVGRVAGLTEDDIHARWEKNEREPVIDQALGVKPKRR